MMLHPCVGMLSKSRGQILRVAATMHVLFHLDTPLTIPSTISEDALKAAQSFVELCNEHAACLAGRGDIGEAIENIQQLRRGITVNIVKLHIFGPLTCTSYIQDTFFSNTMKLKSYSWSPMQRCVTCINSVFST